MVTEQNPAGLGHTLAEFKAKPTEIIEKKTFHACRTEEFLKRLPVAQDLVVAGCESHVCVLQTVRGLVERGCRVFVVEDAIGSRTETKRQAAIRRMEKNALKLLRARWWFSSGWRQPITRGSERSQARSNSLAPAAEFDAVGIVDEAGECLAQIGFL